MLLVTDMFAIKALYAITYCQMATGSIFPVKVSRTMRLQSVHIKFGLGMRLLKALLRIEYPVYNETL